MKKTAKRTIAFMSSALALSVFGLSACTKGKFEPYDPNYGQNTLKTECDADMKIDGVLNETRWGDLNERNWLEHKEGADGPYFKFTTMFSDKGVYFAAISEDWRIYYNAPHSNTKNTCFDMYLARIDDYQLNDKVWVSFDCGNTFWSHGLYRYLGYVTVQGGEIGSDSCTGMTLEAFVPWTQLGYSEEYLAENGAPEEIKAVCQYRLPSSGGGTATIWPGYASGSSYGKLYDFNKDGYASADKAYGTLGDSKTGYAKSYDWDISRADEDIFKSNRQGNKVDTGQSYIFFRDVLSENYSISATFTPNINPDSGIPNIKTSTTPKAGLMVGYTDACFSALMIDYKKTNVDSNILELTSSYTISGSTTHTSIYKSEPNEWGNLKDGVRLSCVKYGALFNYYVIKTDKDTGEEKATLVYQETIPNLINAAEPGIQTTNCDVTISNPKADFYETADQSKLTEYLNDTGIYIVKVLDGANGTVTPQSTSVKAGDDLALDIRPGGGLFELQKLEVAYGTGEFEDITADAQAHTSKGQYVIKNVQDNVTIRSQFVRNNEGRANLTGTVKFGSKGVGGVTIAAENQANKTMYYTTVTSSNNSTLGAYSLNNVPTGSYKIYVIAKGYKSQERAATVGVNGAAENFSLEALMMGGNVTVNGKAIASDTSDSTDYSQAENGIITFSAASSANKVVWFSEIGEIAGDFTVSAVFKYNSGSDTDPSAGFIISDGNTSNDYALYALGAAGNSQAGARFYHVASGEWNNRYNMRSNAPGIFHMNDPNEQIIVTLKRIGNTYYLYVDIYDNVKTAATILRGQIDGGENHEGRAAGPSGNAGYYEDNGRTVPQSKIAVGISVKDKSSYTVRIIGINVN